LDELSALREAIGTDTTTLTPAFVEERRLFRLRVAKALQVADVVSNRAVPYGVTNEISSTTDYDCTRSWARAFEGLTMGGVQYRLRFSPSGSVGYAIFGPAGAHDFDVEEVLPIGERALNELYAEDEIEVRRLPRSDEIVIVEPVQDSR
jgi:hypothetical protein